MSDVVFLYVTTESSPEAERIARTLVEENLVACGNLLPHMKSIYRWDNAIQEGEEVVLILKTVARLVDEATNRIKELHSYDCPCVVALQARGGNPAFLNWVEQETSGR